MLPQICYTQFPSIIHEQRCALDARLRAVSNVHVIHKVWICAGRLLACTLTIEMASTTLFKETAIVLQCTPMLKPIIDASKNARCVSLLNSG